jgi:hypothetical protein
MLGLYTFSLRRGKQVKIKIHLSVFIVICCAISQFAFQPTKLNSANESRQFLPLVLFPSIQLINLRPVGTKANGVFIDGEVFNPTPQPIYNPSGKIYFRNDVGDVVTSTNWTTTLPMIPSGQSIPIIAPGFHQRDVQDLTYDGEVISFTTVAPQNLRYLSLDVSFYSLSECLQKFGFPSVCGRIANNTEFKVTGIKAVRWDLHPERFLDCCGELTLFLNPSDTLKPLEYSDVYIGTYDATYGAREYNVAAQGVISP